MRSRVQRIQTSVVGLGMLISLVALGCGGDDGIGKRYRVHGTVIYQGEPVQSGRITFNPESSEGRHASGEIRNGQYTLTTVASNDGALPGRYTVSIMAVEVDDSEVLDNAMGGVGNQIDVIKATQKAVHLVPPKYQLPDTSGLTAEVKEQSNRIDFDLTD